jgi:hypothetical protein
MNALQLKALLLDTITHLKFNYHLHPNYVFAKKQLCEAMGVSTKATSKKLMEMMSLVYEDNGMLNDFTETCLKFNIDPHTFKVIEAQ